MREAQVGQRAQARRRTPQFAQQRIEPGLRAENGLHEREPPPQAEAKAEGLRPRPHARGVQPAAAQQGQRVERPQVRRRDAPEQAVDDRVDELVLAAHRPRRHAGDLDGNRRREERRVGFRVARFVRGVTMHVEAPARRIHVRARVHLRAQPRPRRVPAPARTLQRIERLADEGRRHIGRAPVSRR
ncbi:MAG: hypothetical protein NDJ94_20755 [Vicinamibacteria bacterium]|nr:hypothetical protein [Vicinamibacteria bacterium]